ncbi:MAG: hypothetical protein HGJ94_08580 [Desulfosarcina sp.]|nr:hypothetical protein [Desulfosarcina sp.]MBC2743555.1 hypothetical protein [Desulfosarcina sp.]MBC2766464.1 hypothetical protein [Desulfosarcina sp.]
MQKGYDTAMQNHISSVPWNTLALWQEANTCLAVTIRRNQSVMTESRQLTKQIQHLLESIFPHMDRLCREACPDCADICCYRAWVWADFRDLLFLHLAGIPVPDQQLLCRQGARCRYGGPGGCRLDRIQRPFVCTWYLCPAQTRILGDQPAEKQRLLTTLQQIKSRRRQMETVFIRAVT